MYSSYRVRSVMCIAVIGDEFCNVYSSYRVSSVMCTAVIG